MDLFLPEEQTATLVIFNIFLFLLIFLFTKNELGSRTEMSNIFRKLGLSLMLLFILFSFWGWDWFGHLICYRVIKGGGNSHMEDIYYWIAQNLSPNYIVFRFVVWGSGFFLLLHVFKRLSIPYGLTLFLWSSLYLIWFSYARVSVSMVLMCYGICILYRPYKNKVLSVLLSILSIGGAFYFHKSALFGIVVSLLTIFVTKFGRRTFVILLLCYPILLLIVQIYLNEFLMTEFEQDGGGLSANLSAGQRYLGHDQGVTGIGYMIQSFLEKCPYYILVFISFRMLRSRMYHVVPCDIKAFMRLLFFIVFFSSLFMFDVGANTKIVYERFIRFAAIPACVVLSYFYSIKYNFNYIQFTYKLALAGTIYSLIYTLYNVCVG